MKPKEKLGPTHYFARWISIWAFCAVSTSSVFAEDSGTEKGVHLLVQQADIVVAGTTETAESFWDSSGRVIVTRVRLRAHRYFKGHSQPSIVIETLGGTINGTGMAVSHAATLRPGETVVLLLRHSHYGSHHIVWGGRRGKLPVRVSGAGLRRIGRGAGMAEEDFANWIRAVGE